MGVWRMENIGVYSLEYDFDGMCCLRKQQSTGYAGGYTITSNAITINLLNNVFSPTLNVEEYIYMIACDKNMKVLGLFILAHGETGITRYSAKAVLVRAMICNATNVILARNSHDNDCSLNANEADNFRKLRKIANTVGITIKDNIIMAERKYFSFEEQNIR